MKFIISRHALKRLMQRFRIERGGIESALRHNLKDCRIYKQFESERLIECQDFVLGATIEGDGEVWIIRTAMDCLPTYAERRKGNNPREARLNPKIEIMEDY